MAASARIALKSCRLIDIGANLTDPVFRGIYHGSAKHKDDFQDMLQRCWDVGLEKIIITGGSLKESTEALTLAKTHDRLFCTVGCHPTRCQLFEKSGDPDKYLSDLLSLAASNKDKVVAIGECGLGKNKYSVMDYDRLMFCPKETQLKYFERQMDLAETTKLPMFLHCRSAFDDFFDIVSRHRSRISGGVIHSFDGSAEQAKKFVELGFSIGINGCSLKTAENLQVVASIPTERLLIETDAPWCEIKPTHAGFKHVKTKIAARKKEKFEEKMAVKGRNEPSFIVQVLEIISALHNEDTEELANKIYNNTTELFSFS